MSIGAGLLLLTTLWHRRAVGTFVNPIGKATGVFLMVLLVSVFVSDNMTEGWDNFFGFWPLGFLFLGAAAVRDAANPLWYLWTFLGSAVLASTQGIWHIIQSFLERGFFDGTTQVSTNIWIYSLAMSGGAICALVLMRDKSWPVKALLLAAAASQMLAVFAARRRVTLILLGVLLLTMIPYYLRRSKWALLALVAMIGAGTWMVSSDLRVQRLTSLDQFFAGEVTRTSLWQIGWETFEESPMTGTGLGDFRDDLREVAAAEGKTRFAGANLRHSHCHNTFLHVAATSGVPGFLAFLWWILIIPLWVWRHRKLHQDAAFLALSAWFMLFAAGFTDAPLYSSSRLSAFTLLFGFAWGMMLRARESSLAQPTEAPDSDHAAVA